MQTRVRPAAFQQATAVRSVGLGVTGLLSLLSGAMLVALLIILYVAIGLAPNGLASFGSDLIAAALLGGYLIAAPPVFARRTRATTATVTGCWLLAAVAGYAVLWSVLLLAVRAL